MMETAAVLAVFFLLVVFGFVFYSNAIKNDVGLKEEESIQLEAIKVVQRAFFLPELACSDGGRVIDNCIDLMKLEASLDVINGNEIYYFDKFAFSRIVVNEIYPDEKEWVIYDKSLEEYSYKSSTNIPVSIFDPLENKNSFGVVNVVVFSK